MTERYQDLIDKNIFGGEPLRVDMQVNAAELPAYATVETVDPVAFDGFEEVLFQPETKRKQRYTVTDLAKPNHVLKLCFETDTLQRKTNDSLAGTHPLALELVRPSYGQAHYLKIEVAADSHVELVFFEKESAVSNPEDGGKPAVFLEATVGERAVLDVVYIHPLYLENSGRRNYLTIKDSTTFLYHGKVSGSGKFRWTSINIGDSLVEKGRVDLLAPYARADIGGAAYIPKGCEHFYQYQVRCLTPKARAFVQSHGVVDDGGSGHMVSIADIEKGAHGAKVREENRFITLGKNARAFTDPTLLIDEYDVEASHAATVGQMDEDAMFYLQSRGLTPEQAKRLVTSGFLMPLIDRIPQNELRNQLAN
ncbi:MAG TPA: SufD family Fe-S cluster assembly protein, partial [Clostridiaceae bacterium]|nr:SufD family Fe-S cluster assembly protein [Clostridiaceae bacterium]